MLPEEFLLLSLSYEMMLVSLSLKKKEKLSRFAPADWVKEQSLTKWLSFQRAFYSEVNSANAVS